MRIVVPKNFDIGNFGILILPSFFYVVKNLPNHYPHSTAFTIREVLNLSQ